MKRLLLAGCVVASLAVAACGGGGGGTSPVPGSQTLPQSKGTLAFSIEIPVKTTQSGSKSPQYVSPSTASLTFTVGTGTAQVVNLTPGSPTCPLAGGYYTCTANASVPAGTNESLTINTYDAASGGGNLLSTATTTVTIIANQSNPLTVSLNGVAKTVGFTLSPSFVVVNVGQTVTALLAAYDADGNMIVGDGSAITSSGAQLGGTGEVPTLACTSATGTDCGDFVAGSLNGNDGTIPITYNGDGPSGSAVFTVTLAGFTSPTQTLTVSPAGTATATPTPSPTPSPTPTGTPSAPPTASPTASPTVAPTANAIVNGGFETGSLTPWYTCYVEYDQGPQVDANPVNTNTSYNQPTPGPNTAPTTAPNANDATVQTSTLGGGSAYDGGDTALVGMGLSLTTANRGKGALGICQNVTVPTSGPGLSFWIEEGGNESYYDGEASAAEIFSAGVGGAGLTSTSNTTTMLPEAILLSENNCWNILNLSPTGTAEKPCATNGLGVPNLATGGVWREHGPYDLSAYAGQPITLFLGIWNESTSTTYYNYAYFDDVVLSSGATGTVPIIINKGARR